MQAHAGMHTHTNANIHITHTHAHRCKYVNITHTHMQIYTSHTHMQIYTLHTHRHTHSQSSDCWLFASLPKIQARSKYTVLRFLWKRCPDCILNFKAMFTWYFHCEHSHVNVAVVKISPLQELPSGIFQQTSDGIPHASTSNPPSSKPVGYSWILSDSHTGSPQDQSHIQLLHTRPKHSHQNTSKKWLTVLRTTQSQ